MRLIVFDMDGTLIDTHGLIAEHMAATFSGAGLPVPAASAVRQVIGLSLPVAMARLTRSEDGALIDRLIAQYKAYYSDTLTANAHREPLFPGTLEALERLNAVPDTLLGVATGKGLDGVRRILAKHGIAGFFATLQTPDHNPSKPDPGMLRSAMVETGATPPETVMVGDTSFDIEMAVAAGARAIGVSWGYHEVAELRRAGADLVIDGYDEIDAAIASLLE
jgi:phosphoglycolate phosphatase